MLDVGESIASKNTLTNKQNKKVHEIIEQTKQLMEPTFAAN